MTSMTTLPVASFSSDLQDWALQWQGVATLLFMVLIVFVMWRLVKVMPKTKPQRIKPASGQSVGWADVAGVDDARAELVEIVEFLRDPARFRALGAKVPRGILLHGPPGTGKTLLAKAVAHESGAQFFAQSAASFVEMFAGLGAARIRRLFAIARKNAPAIIFIDELDAVGGRRGMDISGEKDQTLNQLLVEMDGFDTDKGNLVVIAASNLLEKLDPALLRPGRFDRQVFVSPPDVCAREGVLAVHTRSMPLEGVDLGLVAQQDQWADRRRPGQHLQRGGHLRRTAGGDRHHARGLRSRPGAGDRRGAVPARAQRPREEGGGLSRGRPRPARRAAAHRRSPAQDLHRAPRVSAGLHPQPARRGPLPQDPRGARRLHDRAHGGPAAEALVFGAVTTGASDDLRRVARSPAPWSPSTAWGPRAPPAASMARASPCLT